MIDSTKPEEIEGGLGLKEPLWQSSEERWSFGPTSSRWVAEPDVGHKELPTRSSNVDSASTSGPQEIDRPFATPRKLPSRSFGKRSLSSVSHWEGVVEEVHDGTFRARLVPHANGRPIPARVEFAEFDVDELADESDLALVQTGAVFYWTLGRMRNAAGTIWNASLLRFRRLPAPNVQQKQRARRETEELIRKLGVPEST